MQNLMMPRVWLLTGLVIGMAASGRSQAWNEGVPRFCGPSAFGATPKRTFRFTFPVCGSRDDLEFSVVKGECPPGASLDERTGVLSGKVDAPGEHRITVRAKNREGADVRDFVLVIGDRALAITPPMGWTSWNAFTDDIDQELVAASAKALVEKGLAARGYSFVNVDSCWQGNRTAEGTIALQPNEKFPDMRHLTAEIHALGLKAGIYSTPMVIAWGSTRKVLFHGGSGYPLDPCSFHPHFGGCGKVGFEEPDARQFADWGFDWLKYDWPNTDVRHARKMRNALDACDRDIVLQLCTDCNVDDVLEFSKISSLVRGNLDSHDNWDLMLGKHQNFTGADRWLEHIRPGFWYDLDMLAVGCMRIDRKAAAPRPGEKPPKEFANKLSHDEQTSHFAWLAILPAPLFLSCELQHMDDFTLDLVSNEELIEINQDYPARPASFEDYESGKRRIWKRCLSDGRVVMGFFNLAADDWHVTYPLRTGSFVRDVISRADIGKKDKLSWTIPPHATKVVTIR